MSEKYIVRSEKVAARLLDGEMIVMSAVDSTLFNLNSVAAVIWQAADGRTPLSEIVRGLICAEFEVPPDIAYQDAEEFVKELESHGILTVLDRPIADPRSDPEKAWA
jgi:Coenzyme PQQ synthesis protein D (PqqD)